MRGLSFAMEAPHRSPMEFWDLYERRLERVDLWSYVTISRWYIE